MSRRLTLLIAVFAFSALDLGALAATGEKLDRLNVEETRLSAVQSQNVHRLARLLSVLERFGRDPPPALLVSPRDARDAVRAAILVKAMTPELQRRAQAYAVQAADMARQRRLAAVQSEALFETDSARADAMPEPGSGGDALLSRFKHDGVLTAPDSLVAPAPGRVIRAFGDLLPGGGRSNGITIAAASSGRVVSPGPGIVQYVGPVKGWGVIVILRLAGGYHLVLAGLERTSVPVGQSVAAGEPVGTMPQGRQSTSELYLEVREQGSPVDPARWLKTTRVGAG
jgi:septal ring factor EnvC (AmiA/AmiB activator)